MRRPLLNLKLIAALLAEIALLLKLAILSAASPPQITAIQFAVTDPRSEITQSLGPHLLLKVHRAVDAHGRPYGWDFAVIDRRLGDHPNFLFDCLQARPAAQRSLRVALPRNVLSAETDLAGLRLSF